MTSRPENPATALARVVADELARGGVTDAVLAPGSRSTALAMALHAEARIRLHVQVDERSAAFLALGIAKASGRPAAVVTTSGSATTNLHPAVVEAHHGRAPLLLLTSDRPPELRHTAANQTIDQLDLFGRSVRWFVEVGVPEDRPDASRYWRSTVARALAETQGLSGAPGPVHANLAFREPTVPLQDDGRTAVPAPFEASVDGRAGGAPWVSVARPRTPLSGDSAGELAGMIAATERGLLFIGDADVDPVAVEALAAGTGWPLVAEPVSGVRYGTNAIRAAHWLAGHAPFAASARPDLVMRIGRTGLSRPMERLLGPDVPQVLVDADGAWLDPGRSIRELVVADPTTVCLQLSEQLPAPAGSDWLDRWREADALASEAIDRELDRRPEPTEPRTARDVAAGVPDGGLLVVASSMPVRDLDAVMRPRRLRVLANRGTSGIDGFVSTVLGAAIGDGGPVTALLGDLSLLHDANGLLASLDVERVDAVLVVVNNDGGGIFSFLPQAGFPASFERLFGTPHGRDLSRLAGFHEVGHRHVERAGELPAAVDAARADGGIQLVEVRTDRDENVALHRALGYAVAAALEA